MKLNGFVLANSLLTITLSTFLILSANAMEKNNYSKDHSSKSHREVNTLVAAGSQGSNSASKSVDDGLVSKKTTKIEFTVALVIIISGLIISERFQRNQG